MDRRSMGVSARDAMVVQLSTQEQVYCEIHVCVAVRRLARSDKSVRMSQKSSILNLKSL
jgi:hypothetical protein